MAKATREENIARARRHMEARWERSAEIFEANRESQSQRSPQTQLKRLDRRLGTGVGAKKERAKLAKKSEPTYVA